MVISVSDLVGDGLSWVWVGWWASQWLRKFRLQWRQQHMLLKGWLYNHPFVSKMFSPFHGRRLISTHLNIDTIRSSIMGPSKDVIFSHLTFHFHPLRCRRLWFKEDRSRCIYFISWHITVDRWESSRLQSSIVAFIMGNTSDVASATEEVATATSFRTMNKEPPRATTSYIDFCIYLRYPCRPHLGIVTAIPLCLLFLKKLYSFGNNSHCPNYCRLGWFLTDTFHHDRSDSSDCSCIFFFKFKGLIHQTTKSLLSQGLLVFLSLFK